MDRFLTLHNSELIHIFHIPSVFSVPANDDVDIFCPPSPHTYLKSIVRTAREHDEGRGAILGMSGKELPWKSYILSYQILHMYLEKYLAGLICEFSCWVFTQPSRSIRVRSTDSHPIRIRRDCSQPIRIRCDYSQPIKVENQTFPDAFFQAIIYQIMLC